MTREERKIRFDVALETVQKVYSDYCKDPDMTREQCYDFNDFVQSMLRFSKVLGKEAKEKDACVEEKGLDTMITNAGVKRNREINANDGCSRTQPLNSR